MSRRDATWILTLVVLASLSACGAGADARASGAGVAMAKVAGREWRIEGTCEFSGDDMTFTAPGDPMLNIGFNTASTPTVVGNLSSQGEGFVSFIGHPEVPSPTVSVDGSTYSVSGTFFIDVGVSVDGDIAVTCE